MPSSCNSDSCTPFKVFWAEAVYPQIKDDLERLSRTAPKRMTKKAVANGAEAHDQICAKIISVVEEAQTKGERRNAYMNLAWTGPVDNSYLQEKITLGKVENMAADLFLSSLPTDDLEMAADLFLSSLPTDAAAKTAPDSQETADDGEEEEEEEEAEEEAQPQRKAERRVVETLSQTAKRPWNIPLRVEKGFEIPIMVLNSLYPPPSAGSSDWEWTSWWTQSGWLTIGHYRKATPMLKQRSRS